MPKVVITGPHYFAELGYVDASPEYPKVVELHERWIRKGEVDQSPFMKLCDVDEVEGTPQGKHFADGPRQHTQSSAQVQSEPVKDKSGKRAADKSPI